MAANAAYRRGEPIVSDDTYDHVYLAELIKRDPNHPYLNVVQPEPETIGSGKVRHIKPMLSTDKAYTQEEINSFIARVIKQAATVDVAEVGLRFRITAKLDGMAANYENKQRHTFQKHPRTKASPALKGGRWEAN